VPVVGTLVRRAGPHQIDEVLAVLAHEDAEPVGEAP